MPLFFLLPDMAGQEERRGPCSRVLHFTRRHFFYPNGVLQAYRVYPAVKIATITTTTHCQNFVIDSATLSLLRLPDGYLGTVIVFQ